jgi:transcription antitermination factor NusG
MAIESTPGVAHIVKASQRPYMIPDAEVDSLWTMLGSGYPVNAAPYPQPGDIVRVGLNANQDLQGTANQDLQGIVLQAGEMYRVFVSLSALLRCFYIEVPRSAVTFKDNQQ